MLVRESGWEARQTLWQIPDPSLPVLNLSSQNMLKDDEVARFPKKQRHRPTCQLSLGAGLRDSEEVLSLDHQSMQRNLQIRQIVMYCPF
jgi:hypothetical protein